MHMFLISLHRFIASLMPYYNFVSRGWKLPSPDRCSLSLASPAQPGRDIYHFRTLHSEWPAQSRLLSQSSPAWLSQAKPAEPSPALPAIWNWPEGPGAFSDWAESPKYQNTQWKTVVLAPRAQKTQFFIEYFDILDFQPNLKLARGARSLLRLGWKS